MIFVTIGAKEEHFYYFTIKTQNGLLAMFVISTMGRNHTYFSRCVILTGEIPPPSDDKFSDILREYFLPILSKKVTFTEMTNITDTLNQLT